MAVKIRLRRMGKKKRPIYKIVAADVRSPRDGKFLEALGLYNPLTDPHTVDIKEERVLYWLSKGAQPTKTVKSLLRQKGITLKNELIKRGANEEEIEAKLSEWEKLKEAGASQKVKKKKISKKAKSKEEVSEKSGKPEETSEDSSEIAEDAKDDKVAEDAKADESTAEVKGAASDENDADKE
ncbi:MAG: 30S ribosomal protein S16 [Bacteroidetes bacterium]|nr:30S ribosomal protein S16 [Bacteroidota bacterium]MCH9028013.1 30S ribosomal protein S16 [Bacteroidota bacterium]